MPTNKRRQTMAKLARERAVEAKRALKREKKEAARALKAQGGVPDEGAFENGVPEDGVPVQQDETEPQETAAVTPAPLDSAETR